MLINKADRGKKNGGATFGTYDYHTVMRRRRQMPCGNKLPVGVYTSSSFNNAFYELDDDAKAHYFNLMCNGVGVDPGKHDVAVFAGIIPNDNVKDGWSKELYEGLHELHGLSPKDYKCSYDETAMDLLTQFTKLPHNKESTMKISAIEVKSKYSTSNLLNLLNLKN